MGNFSCPRAKPTHYRKAIGFITGFRGDLLSSAFASRGDLLSSGGGTCCPVDKSPTPQAFVDNSSGLPELLRGYADHHERHRWNASAFTDKVV